MSIRQVFIGYDRGEETAARVAKLSIERHAKRPVLIKFLNQEMLRRAGLYTRTSYREDVQHYDAADHKPFSTEFSFTRFLVPALMQWEGMALFIDSDVLLRADITSMFEAYENPHYSVRVVQHNYVPEAGVKMRDGLKQEPYKRKNWSSVILFNCSHPSCQTLTPTMVNSFSGRYLHTFQWAATDTIGNLPEEWNWLEGHSDTTLDPKLVHFTRGTPDVPAYANVVFADEWWAHFARLEEAA